MSHRHLLILLGTILIAMGIVERGWVLLLVWPGANFLVLGIAHATGTHGLFGKRQDGSLPLWSWIVFLPLILYTTLVWNLIRLFLREPAHHKITNDLIIGRRLLPGELDGEFENYIDLTAEFPEPPAIGCKSSYQCFPILDGAAPDVKNLTHAIERLRPGRTFIHCAQGHGRTGLFALAILIKRGLVRDVDEGLNMLRKIRPGISLNKQQRRCVEEYAATAFANLIRG
jgi:hypothetical protein